MNRPKNFIGYGLVAAFVALCATLAPYSSTVSAGPGSQSPALTAQSLGAAPSVSQLKAMIPPAGTRAATLGYNVAGDGGGWDYYYDATDTTTADNGGSVLASTVPGATGRWKAVKTDTISVKQFGAKGDTKDLSDGAMTNGSAVLNSPSQANFTAADQGKSIAVWGAAPSDTFGNQVPLNATILSVQSATSCTLSANATATVTGGRIVFGTDDSTAIKRACAMIQANGGGTLTFPPGVYKVTNGSGFWPNSVFAAFSGLNGVHFVFNDAKIITSDTYTYTNSTIGWVMFQFTTCSNVEFRSAQIEGVQAFPHTSRQGIVPMWFLTGCRNVKFTGKITGTAYGLWAGNYGDWTVGNSRGFDIDMEFYDVGYPCVGQSSLSDSTVRVHGSRCHRACYLTGSKNVRANVSFADSDAPMAVLVGGNPNTGDPNTATMDDGSQNIVVDALDTGSTWTPTYGTFGASLNNWLFGLVGSTNSGTGVIENITLRGTRVLTASGPSGMGFCEMGSGGLSGPFNPNTEFRNITLSGTFDRSALPSSKAGPVMYLGNGLGQASPKVTNLRFSDLVIVENPSDPVTNAANGIVLTLGQPTTPIFWDRVRAPLTPGTLQANVSSASVLDASNFGNAHEFRDCDVPLLKQSTPASGAAAVSYFKDHLSDAQSASGRSAGLFVNGGTSTTQAAYEALAASIGTGSFTLELTFRSPHLLVQYIRGLCSLSSVNTGAAGGGLAVETDTGSSNPGNIDVYFFGATLSDYRKYTIDGLRGGDGPITLHVVRDSAAQSLTFYVNGRAVGATSSTAGTPPADAFQSLTTTYMVLGQTRPGTSQAFYGTLYGAKVYGCAFTGKEVADSISGHSPPITDGAVAVPPISRTAGNGSFETAGAGGADVFANWTEGTAGTSSINADTTAGNFTDGTTACRLDVDGSNSLAQVTQNSLTSGRMYRVSFAAKASALSSSMSVTVGGSTYNVTLSTSWVRYAFYAKATSTAFSIQRNSAASKSIWIDDVLVEEMGVLAAPNLRAGGTGTTLPDSYNTGRSLTLVGAGFSRNVPIDTLTEIADGQNVILGTTTGSQIGTATSQKIGFLGATPVAQQANNISLEAVLSNFGLRASGTAAPLSIGILGATHLGVTPSSSGLGLRVNRVNSGADNNTFWGATIQNSGATDTLDIGVASSTYATGGTFKWIANSDAFIRYPTTFKIGRGTGNDSTLWLNASGQVGVGGSPSQRLNVQSGALRFDYAAVPSAPTAALAGLGSGNLSNGSYSYRVTYVNALGETTQGAAAGVSVADHTTNGQVSLSGIPLSTDTTVTSRKIYRTLPGGTSYFLLTTLADNTTTTYTDNVADGSLGAAVPTINTTAGSIFAGATKAGAIGSDGNVTFTGQLSAKTYVSTIATPTYGATVTMDASAGAIQKLTITDGNAFTLAAPTNPVAGEHMTVIIINSSGGGAGAITWNAAFKMDTSFAAPANTKRRVINFVFDGTNWDETSPSTGDM